MALAAFNVFDFDTIRAISDAAAKINTQVFLQFSASTVKYYGAKTVSRMIDLGCGDNRQFLIVHLDHCDDIELIQDCILAGWDSVMADYSGLALEENIRNMLEIKKRIGNRRVMVEGELGQIAGVEDGQGTDEGSFVSPADVMEFVEKTKLDLLAVGIGNAHGFYKSTDGIDIGLLKKIHMSVPDQKLVLHGGTGIEEFKINEMKNYGIHKINISTELKEVYLRSEEQHNNSAKRFNMIKLVDIRYEAVKELAIRKMQLFR